MVLLNNLMAFIQAVRSSTRAIANTFHTTMQKLYNDKDGIAHLLKDHDSFRKLFARYKESTNNVEKLHIVDQIVLEVSQHASAEERYVYPLIMTRIDQGKLLYERNVLDDQVNKEILQFLDTNIPTTPSEFALYFSTVEKFIAVESEHLEQEEREVLTPLNEVLSIEEKSALEDDILFAKKYGPTHPHPGAPAKPSQGSNILHPLAGLADKIMDSITGRPDHSKMGGVSAM